MFTLNVIGFKANRFAHCAILHRASGKIDNSFSPRAIRNKNVKM